MKDIRMIRLRDDNTIAFVDDMSGMVTGLEAAIQRFVLAFLVSPGTIVEAPSYGGGGKRLYLARRVQDRQTRERVENVLVDTKQSLLPHEPVESPHRIVDLTLRSINRTSGRGYRISVDLEFAGASSQPITIPSETYGTP